MKPEPSDSGPRNRRNSPHALRASPAMRVGVPQPSMPQFSYKGVHRR